MTATLDNQLADLRRANAELQRRLDERTAERDEALERETATAEVLGVINSSPGDLAPVFDAMLEKAMRLCEAAFGGLWMFGDRYVATALRGVPQAYADFLRGSTELPGPGTGAYRFFHGERSIIHNLDLADEEPYRTAQAGRVALVELGGARTALQVPLCKDETVLGLMTIYRQEVRAFTEKQIALLQNFATQAVIAMENARLITEAREALEQQTATAEVLQVINSSPGDLAPVFQTMLDRAMGLCEATFGHLATYDGDRFHTAAIRGVPAPFAEFRRQSPQVYGPGTGVARLLAGERFVHFIDSADTDAYRSGDPNQRAVVDLGGARSMLVVPFLKDEAVVGFITIYRQEVRPFSDKQIALLQNFAAQAVIAMENARLLDELQQRTDDLTESLEYQTATSDVLKVISRSAFDLDAVLKTVVDAAARLCAADHAGLYRNQEGEYRWAAGHNQSPQYERIERNVRITVGPDTLVGRTALALSAVQILDAQADPQYGPQEDARAGGVHSLLGVPLLREGLPVGVIGLARNRVEAFTDKQVELVSTFADQAVIAIENARLIAETQEALDQQTATAEVLQVINSSPGDLAPIFDAMLEKAMRLCEAAFGILVTVENEAVEVAAQRNLPTQLAEFMTREPMRLDPATLLGKSILERRVLHTLDDAISEAYSRRAPLAVAAVEFGGVRTVLHVPLIKDDRVAGVFIIFRQEVRPFTDKQIALLQNFAAQAVIAMENARLITETREALDQQTATAEVLQVINSSPGDLRPVFDAMLDKATGLCDAPLGTLWLCDGQHLNPVAIRGASPSLGEFLRQGPHEPNPVQRRQLAGEGTIHLVDLMATELYRDGDTLARAVADLGGIQTVLSVPLRREDRVIGLFGVYRQDPRPFSEKQIALIENFAAQAVIAIENARLITETREALERQTATAEVLGVINSSPGDLAPVFDAMLEKAHALCGVSMGALEIWDGVRVRALAARGLPSQFEDLIRQGYEPGPNDPHWALVRGDDFVQVANLSEIDDPTMRRAIALVGDCTFLAVALRKDDLLLGRIVANRSAGRPFSEKQIALLQNFAAQAVIAMENARLITETREALEQQTATAEVLQVINSSPGDLAPVFDAMLEKALTLCGAAFGQLVTYDGEGFQPEAVRGEPRIADWLMQRGRVRPGPGTTMDRLSRGDAVVQIADVADDEGYRRGDATRRTLVDIGGCRTVLSVALRKDDALLGAITVYRQEVRPFSDKQIALLQNFAAQAVVAMENARLIAETREALDQQTATAEVLGVINGSQGDLGPVFEAMLEKARVLCGFAHGTFNIYDGEYFRTVAFHAIPEPFAEVLRQPRRTGPQERLLRGERVVHIADVAAREFTSDDPVHRAAVELGGTRTLLMVPLRKDGALLGYITANRREVRPFSNKQITLLENFAAQAVIAMENARLITETREALEQQTATAEVLQVINSSPGDLQPVFEAILEKAHNLCGVAYGSLQLYDGERFRAVAVHGLSNALADRLRHGYIPGSNLPVSRLLDGERFAHVADLAQVDDLMAQSVVELGGTRTVLWVALRKDQKLLGAIAAARLEVRPFSEKEIALLDSFAAQAVIAMDNARLLAEIRQRQAELRTTFDNMADGVVMFDEDLRLAACNQNFRELLDIPDSVLAERPTYEDYLRILAERGEFGADDIEAELSRRLERTDQEYRVERTRPDGRVIEVRRNAVPDGGFVLIYSDITERKRSEAEIRAARDAAEATLRDLRAAQANLVQAEKMASLGQLTAGIAHEIKNPLNFVNNFAGLSVELLDELRETTAPAVATLGDDRRAEFDETMVMLSGNLEKIAEHGRRADNIVKSMLEHSRGVSGERREVDLNGLIEEALNLAYHGARAQDPSFNITMDRNFERGLRPIKVAPQEITRVFLNLFGNGFYAANKRFQESGAGGSFRPTLTVSTRDLGDAVEVRVRDNGTGIPPEIRDKLFQPFFTTKPTGEGTGLGLSISYDIVTQQHGGTIDVDSEVGEFTEFTLRLPRSQTTGRVAA